MVTRIKQVNITLTFFYWITIYQSMYHVIDYATFILVNIYQHISLYFHIYCQAITTKVF